MYAEPLSLDQRRQFPASNEHSSETLPELDRFLSRREVSRLTCLAKTALYARIARGEFPKPIRLSKSKVAWSARDVARWQRDVRQCASPSTMDAVKSQMPTM